MTIATLMAGVALGLLLALLPRFFRFNNDAATAVGFFLVLFIYNLKNGILCHAFFIDEDYYRYGWHFGRKPRPYFGGSIAHKAIRMAIATFVTLFLLFIPALLVLAAAETWFPLLRFVPYTGGG